MDVLRMGDCLLESLSELFSFFSRPVKDPVVFVLTKLVFLYGQSTKLSVRMPNPQFIKCTNTRDQEGITRD